MHSIPFRILNYGRLLTLLIRAEAGSFSDVGKLMLPQDPAALKYGPPHQNLWSPTFSFINRPKFYTRVQNGHGDAVRIDVTR